MNSTEFTDLLEKLKSGEVLYAVKGSFPDIFRTPIPPIDCFRGQQIAIIIIPIADKVIVPGRNGG